MVTSVQPSRLASASMDARDSPTMPEMARRTPSRGVGGGEGGGAGGAGAASGALGGIGNARGEKRSTNSCSALSSSPSPVPRSAGVWDEQGVGRGEKLSSRTRARGWWRALKGARARCRECAQRRASERLEEREEEGIHSRTLFTRPSFRTKHGRAPRLYRPSTHPHRLPPGLRATSTGTPRTPAVERERERAKGRATSLHKKRQRTPVWRLLLLVPFFPPRTTHTSRQHDLPRRLEPAVCPGELWQGPEEGGGGAAECEGKTKRRALPLAQPSSFSTPLLFRTNERSGTEEAGGRAGGGRRRSGRRSATPSPALTHPTHSLSHPTPTHTRSSSASPTRTRPRWSRPRPRAT